MAYHLKVAVAAGLALLSPSLAGCDPIARYEHDILPYYSACGGTPCVDYRGPVEALSLEGLYAVHRLGMRGEPWRLQTDEFVRRGPAAAAFLKEKLAAIDEPRAVYSIFQVFLRMQEAKVFDASSDRELIQLIQSRATEARDGWSLWFRDDADQLEHRERYARGVSAGSKEFGKDYNAEFVKSLCRDCDHREWRAAAKDLSLEQLFWVQQYGWSVSPVPMVLDSEMVSRGAGAIPFLKQRLRAGETGKATWIILNTVQLMQETGKYDVRGDRELMALVAAAASSARGSWRRAIVDFAAQIKSGAPNPISLDMRLGYRIA